MEIELRRKPVVASTDPTKVETNEKKDLQIDDFDLADSDREEYHNNVDILFVLDTTGSMGSYFSPAIETIKKIVEKFNKMEFNIKFGLCTYRDHPPQETTYVTEFTDLTSAKKLVEVLSKVSAAGGGDGPEAVMDGLRVGLSNSQWRVGEDGTTISKRFLFHICDAPPHGEEYGGSSSDSEWQKNGCPCGTKKEDINKLLKDHKVDYHLIKAVSSVDKMETVFKECFGENYAETIALDSPGSTSYGGAECEELCDDYEAERVEMDEDDCYLEEDCEKPCEMKECEQRFDEDFDLKCASEKEEMKPCKEKAVKRKKAEKSVPSKPAASSKKAMWEGVIGALDKKLM